MSRGTSLPSQIPILPLFDQAVLLPGLRLPLRITNPISSALLSHILRSDPATLGNLVLGCVPVTSGSGIAEIIGEDGNSRPALPAPPTSDQHAKSDDVKPRQSDLEFGCTARIITSLSRLDRSYLVSGYILVVEGISRFRIDRITQKYPYIEASVTHFPDETLPITATPLLARLKSTATDLVRQITAVNSTMQKTFPMMRLEAYISRADRGDAGQLADLCVVAFEGRWEEKLAVLRLTDVKARLEKALEILTRQVGMLQVSKKVGSNVSNKLTKQQREFYLRQQLNAIKEELGSKENDSGGEDDDLAELQKRIESANPPRDVMSIAKRELQRLKRIPQASAEHNVIRTYIEVLADIPWSRSSTDDLDIARARKQFDDDHYGLEKVKKRLLDYIAILKLKRSLAQPKHISGPEQSTTPDQNKLNSENPQSVVKVPLKAEPQDRAPILLLVGPPGTGKTSLAKSVATALGRKFHRISLGGVRDEAEIRGHRRTYVASLPGLIIQGLRKVGVNNPVFLLDEIDKIGMNNHHGDPSAAMLEVLDPEQNHTFKDHYVDFPVDLSKILFIATANSEYTIHDALLDRMEVIELPGYTFDEKLHIARGHLIPKQLETNALDAKQLETDDKTILKIITGYTREAGVRGLERRLGAVCRAKAVQYAETMEQNKQSEYDPRVTIDDLEHILGTERYEDEVAQATANPGIVTGLVVAGGSTGEIIFIECTEMPGSGNLQLTGQLGEIMRESASVAMSWVKSNAFILGLTDSAASTLVKDRDIHVHFPVGAIPKDGPSAGIGLTVGLISLLSQRAVDPKIAMTGEMSLRGHVLPIGGLKHKILAAHRAGIETVLLPKRNQKDLKEIPIEVKEKLRLVPVSTMWDVLREIWPNDLKDHIGIESRL